MSLIDDALLARRDQLVAALYDQPALREKLSIGEITAAVDVALRAAGVRTLLDGLVAAQTLTDAVVAGVPTPPPAVAGALTDYSDLADQIQSEGWNIYA